MKTGTKSVLFGAHCFAIHPWFVAIGWWKLYGFPFDPRLWVAFFLHDLGYIGKRAMDDPEGERHPEWAARVMTRLFDRKPHLKHGCVWVEDGERPMWTCGHWGQLCLFHSRFYAKQYDHLPSRLCFADKLVPSIEPWWLYLPRARASGELWEYLSRAGGKDGGKYAGEPNSAAVQALVSSPRWRDWYDGMALFCVDYVAQHKDGRADDWTKGAMSQPKGDPLR